MSSSIALFQGQSKSRLFLVRGFGSIFEEAVEAGDRLFKQHPDITSVEVMRGVDGFCPAVRERSRDGDEFGGWQFRTPTPGTFHWDKKESRFVVIWEGGTPWTSLSPCGKTHDQEEQIQL